MSDDWDVIYSYTRKQAIEDGVLMAVDKDLSKEAGFKVPVALTSTLYDKYIKSNLPGQDETGRLWDVLFMLRIKASSCESNIILFKVIFLISDEKHETVKLKAEIGPGDDYEPVMTIMFPEED